MKFTSGPLLILALFFVVFVIRVSINIQNKPKSILGKEMNEEKSPAVDQSKKSQEPTAPYHIEEVYYNNNDAGIKLAGTISMPLVQEPVSAVLLIAGYGPHDRDVTSMGHKYFFVLADYLTRQGMAVLRVDKRGVGKSTGVYEEATSKDLASDVQAGISYLKTRVEINHNQIGLVGLSEGGLIASMVAAESKDVAFIVLMAPAVASKMKDLVDQALLQLRADGASEEFIVEDRAIRTTVYSIVRQEPDVALAEKKLRTAIECYLVRQPENLKKEAERLPFAFTEVKKDALIKTFNSAWYRFFFSHDTPLVLRKIQIPVLAINGDRDWIASSDKVFAELRNAFEASGKKNYTLVELEDLNHCFQTCSTGALMEYATIQETMAPIAMKTISDWILACK